ncbi:MAG: hypothetical protein II767_05340 [Proteobacteria bacterium]|nr:hypothetical protein [Pseudomonadota bacterium]MBQ4359662.1 hypothetical protein [Pseudomonadota bacterium]
MSAKTLKNIHPLKFILEDKQRHDVFVGAIESHLETEISSMSMIKGLVIKKAYAAVKSVRPGYIRHILNVLTNDYIEEFAPMYEDFRTAQNLPAEKVKPFGDYVKAHRDEADKHFWKIADAYAEKKSDSIIGKAYKAGRSMIGSHLPTVYRIICSEIDNITVYEEKA